MTGGLRSTFTGNWAAPGSAPPGPGPGGRRASAAPRSGRTRRAPRVSPARGERIHRRGAGGAGPATWSASRAWSSRSPSSSTRSAPGRVPAGRVPRQPALPRHVPRRRRVRAHGAPGRGRGVISWHEWIRARRRRPRQPSRHRRPDRGDLPLDGRAGRSDRGRRGGRRDRLGRARRRRDPPLRARRRASRSRPRSPRPRTVPDSNARSISATRFRAPVAGRRGRTAGTARAGGS